MAGLMKYCIPNCAAISHTCTGGKKLTIPNMAQALALFSPFKMPIYIACANRFYLKQA